MTNTKCEKIESDNFMHDYYHSNYYIFSKVEKEPQVCDIIQQICSKTRAVINLFRNIAHAEKNTGFNNASISQCINHPETYKTHKGFIWKKIENQQPIHKTKEEIEEELNRNIIKGHVRHGDRTIPMIRKDGKKKNVRIHRLIYYIHNQLTITSCEECGDDQSIFCVFDTKHDIDHINGLHEDNRPDNLQRLCPSCHAIKTNKQTRASGTRKSCSEKKKVKFNVYENEKLLKTFDSMEECVRELGISHNTIRRSFERKEYTRSIKGRKFLFEEITLEVDGEIWKDIKDQKGQCSNKGRIKTGKKIITYGGEKNGYLLVSSKRVHITIAMTFLEKEYEKKVLEIQQKFPDVSIEEIKNSTGKPYSLMVDHIDRNTKNNCLENLRWVSVHENNLNKDSVKEVEQWTLDGKTLLNTFKSQIEAGEKLGLSSSEISCAISGYNGRKQAGGFIFKFKEDGVNSVDAVQTDAEKSYDIFLKNFESFKQFLIDNERTPRQRKDGFLGIWYNSMKQKYKNKSACMSYETVYNVWDEFINRDENREYFLDWNDTWTINFNKIQDGNLCRKLTKWIQVQNRNYKNRTNSMSTKNQAQYDKWSEFIENRQILN